MRKQTLLFILGTRPEAIKLSPLIKICQEREAYFDVKVCMTGQHRELVDNVLEYFGIIPDFDLKIMAPQQTLTSITTRTLAGIEPILTELQPDWVIVQGDTTAAFSGALAAFYQQIKIAHVEAGLRSFDIYAPYPEEINRQFISRLAAIHFAPTEGNRQNLLKEGVPNSSIYLVGNTVVDALNWTIEKEKASFSNENHHYSEKRIILVTAHRRENWGAGMLRIAEALKQLAIMEPNIEITIVRHPNPEVSNAMLLVLKDIPQIIWMPPLDYKMFTRLMYEAYFILTDSGGVQEEATALHKPVLVMRDKTERDEILTSGSAILVGTHSNSIVEQCHLLLTDEALYKSMTQSETPFGDGQASIRIADFIEKYQK